MTDDIPTIPEGAEGSQVVADAVIRRLRVRVQQEAEARRAAERELRDLRERPFFGEVAA